MGDMKEMAARFDEVLRAGDLAGLTALTQEFATDDFIDEYPQSGERITKAGAIQLAEKYGEMTGTSPTFSYRRMFGGDDHFVVEATIDYGDGVPVSYVGIGELRDGKIAHMTEYFANPFDAPAWRAAFVEQPEPVKA